MRVPDVGIASCEDVGEVALALHTQRRELGDVDGTCPVVAMLDQQPGSIATAGRTGAPAPALRADEYPRAFQLDAFEREFEIPLLQRRIHIVDLRLPRAAVPEHDNAGAVAGGYDAFEITVLDWMIFHRHRQALRRRIQRRALRHGP